MDIKYFEENAKDIFTRAKDYFANKYPYGTHLTQVMKDFNASKKIYNKFLDKNLRYGRTRYNFELKKARNDCFMMETVERLILISKEYYVDDLEFCITNFQETKQKFAHLLERAPYYSYDQQETITLTK